MPEERSAPGPDSGATWRDCEHYRPLRRIDRAGWAWEWLRRDPDFITAVRQAGPGLRRAVSNGEKSKSTFEPLRIIDAADTERFGRWGVIFRGRSPPSGPTPERLLVGRLQSPGPRCRSETGRPLRQRRL